MNDVINNLKELFDVAFKENMDGRGTVLTKMVTTFIPDAIQNLQAYKGYTTKVKYSNEDNVFFGKIEGINSLVDFEAESIDKVKNAFEEAVNNYLAFCEENNLDNEI